MYSISSWLIGSLWYLWGKISTPDPRAVLPILGLLDDEDGGFMGTEDTIGVAFLNDISAEDN